MSTTFAARLNRLFDTVYPPGRGPHTSAEVIAALKAEGVTMSAPYLSQLRSGNRTNPSSTTMAALANYFRIKPAYFTDDEYYEKLDKELTWLAGMRDEGVRRIAARTVGLSPEAQQDWPTRSTSCVARNASTIDRVGRYRRQGVVCRRDLDDPLPVGVASGWRSHSSPGNRSLPAARSPSRPA